MDTRKPLLENSSAATAHTYDSEQVAYDAYGSGDTHVEDHRLHSPGEKSPRRSPRSFSHPPGGNFHDHEYGSVDECAQCNDVDELVDSWSLKLSAFFVGAGISISWNVVFISEAYFQSVLGKSVLSKLGSTVDGLTLAGMLFFLTARRFLSYRGIIMFHFLYGVVLAITIPLMVLSDTTVTSGTVYGLMSILGLSCGMAKATGGAIAGLYPGATFSAMMLLGSSFSALAPTLTEVYLLTASARHTSRTSASSFAERQQLYTVFAMGLVLSLIALVSGWRVTGTGVFQRARAVELERLHRIDVQVGKNKIQGRLRTIQPCLAVLVINWTLCIYTLSLCPRVQSRGDWISSNRMFWELQLPTFIITCANLGFFTGNLFSSKLLAQGMINRERASWLMNGVLCLLAGLAALLLVYVNEPYVTTGGNTFVLCMYFALCAVAGFLSNATSSLAQLQCSFTGRHLCPIVGTLCWFAVQSGIFLGAALSFLH